MGVRINPTAQFQPAARDRRFRVLNALDVVRILPAMESTLQEIPIYGIVIILMELSKATTNIAFP